ncbi:helix-turn-helix domain-containing protein [Parapedobacter koreensis]|uniref:Uncharacterized protein n=1 Tax=Parapedobacter koreensis TaxID=332977 RepID=A0A1H7FGE4_9SPHI|nr:helix-turn-helix transcriptional regulator [Parapedobacter koreensis]SEK24327.1 hypothetical protein SAMN05421740_101321 [Parapedobacter koreensis]
MIANMNKEIIPEELLKTIGKNLAKIRSDKGEDLKDVAKAVGVKAVDLEKVEAGVYPLTIELLVILVNHFDTSLQQVMEVALAQIYYFTQTNSTGSSHKQYVVNDHTNGYELLVEQLQKEVEYLRGYFEKYVALTSSNPTE